MGNEVADASVWQARAAAWELAALSLRYPDAELAEAAAGGEWDEAAGEILAALGAARGGPRGGGRSRRPSRRPRGRRRGRRGRRRAPARPAPGGHAPVRRGARARLLALRGRVGRRGRRGAAASVREPPLHGGRALHALLRPRPPRGHQRAPRPRRHGMRAPGAPGPARGRSPGFRGRPGRRRPPWREPGRRLRTFLSGHAQAWMPAFAERLAAEARHPFYRAAAAYLGALVG